MALSQRRARLVARLRTRGTREREQLVLVEGVRAAREALAADAEVRFAVTAPRLRSTPAGAELDAALANRDVTEVSDEELAALADTRNPQGVLLVCREPPGGLDRLEGARFLLLDGVQDPGNAGTLVRGAIAFGLDGVVCLDGAVDPWGAKAVRASAGLVFRAGPVRAHAAEALAWLGERRVPILVAAADGRDAALHRGAGRFALVVGNEGSGVRAEVRVAAEATLAVRMVGPAESLNAGVAGSILMYILAGEDARE